MLEGLFQKRTELKTANTWMSAMKAREDRKQQYLTTGSLKPMIEVVPSEMVQMIEHPAIEPVVIFSQEQLKRITPKVQR